MVVIFCCALVTGAVDLAGGEASVRVSSYFSTAQILRKWISWP